MVSPNLKYSKRFLSFFLFSDYLFPRNYFRQSINKFL
jgi:hypothetical protein